MRYLGRGIPMMVLAVVLMGIGTPVAADPLVVVINRPAPLGWHYAAAGFGGTRWVDSAWVGFSSGPARQEGPGASATLTSDPSETLFSATSQAAAWDLRGAASANGYVGVWSWAEFGDEWFLETYNSLPAIVEFNLDVHVEILHPYYTTGFDLSLDSPRPTGVGWYGLDWTGFSSSADTTVALSSAGLGTLYPGEEPIYMVASGSYFPMSLWAQGTCWYEGCSVDWLNTVTLNTEDPFNVYQLDAQGTRIELTPSQYALTRQAVPEPASLLLLAAGLSVACWRRRR